MYQCHHTKVTTSNYQPGGTCTAAIGHWISHAHMAMQDPHSMGQWSSIKFEGRNECWIVIATGYRLCNQQSQLGSSTFHNQQYQILLKKGIAQPNPQEQFFDDLITQVNQWHQSWKAVLFCLDANNDVTCNIPTQGIARLMAKTNLIDFHCLCHPNQPCPSTYNHGTRTINSCLGSPE